MKRMVNWLLSGILFSGVAGLVACEETEEAFNCTEICETYADCAKELNQDVNVSSCASACEDKSDQSEDFKDDAEACATCLEGDIDCSENLACSNECAGVVPDLAI